MAAKDDLGRAGEERTAEYLKGLGWQILDRNWRCAQGEVDVVARDRHDVVIVEVKTRRGLGYGHPFESITGLKLVRLRRLAAAWIADHPAHAGAASVRIDAVAITGLDPWSGTLEHLRGIG